MVKTSRIRLEELSSALKALFPIFAGIVFLGLILYIISIYQYQSRLNAYFVLNEDRNSLQSEYKTQFEVLSTQLGSLEGKSSNRKLDTLKDAEEFNLTLIDLVEGMITDGYELLHLDIAQNQQFDLAMNELNFLRIQLHIQIATYIDRQVFAINYIKLKDSTESCYNKVDLGSNSYSEVVMALNKCASKLEDQVEYIESVPNGVEGFSKTRDYLNKYETYWGLVKQMYSLLSRDRTDQAKDVSSDVKKQLQKLPSAQKAAESELNTILLKSIEDEIESVTEQINSKSEEVRQFDSSNSF
jgi:hypothetical protein